MCLSDRKDGEEPDMGLDMLDEFGLEKELEKLSCSSNLVTSTLLGNSWYI